MSARAVQPPDEVAESESMPSKRRGPRPSGPSGPSGQHRSARRPVGATAAQWKRWDRLAARAGLSWADWVRSLLDAEQPRPRPAGSGAGGGPPYPVRRMLSGSAAQWAAWDAKAARAELSFAAWVRQVQDRA